MNQPDLEVKQWSEAEKSLYLKKHKVYVEAVAALNECLEFLKQQYSIDAKDGWQLGDGGFVRVVSPQER